MVKKRPHELLSDSLRRVERTARKGVVRSSDIGRLDRERLARNGWLMPVIRGWYLLNTPGSQEGASTVWYSCFWDFIEVYLSERYGSGYILSAESSLELHIGSTTIPTQVVAIVEKGGGRSIELPQGTSLLPYAGRDTIPDESEHIRGLRVMSLPLALSRVSPTYFRSSQVQVEVALQTVDATALSRQLLAGGFNNAAGRIVGAYQKLNRQDIVDRIRQDMEAAGYRIVPVNPFEKPVSTDIQLPRSGSPLLTRLEAFWSSMRNDVIDVFPVAPGLPVSPGSYLSTMEMISTTDTYHSLSIEGYQVTEKMIERVKTGQWNPESTGNDQDHLNALTVKGYLECFTSVREDVELVLSGSPPGEIFERRLQDWYRALFSAQVQAGILVPEQLAGYRNNQGYIEGSRHIPPHWQRVTECMELLFNLLKEESESSVRAVLGHFLFGYIHPYMDGNGRLGRFLMNLALASGGYPWTVIRVEDRKQYLAALEAASTDNTIRPLADFLAHSSLSATTGSIRRARRAGR